MNHLPRLIADWLALWRDLPRHPRQVLLNRAHLPGSTLAIASTMLADLVFDHPYTTTTVYAALVLLGPSSLVGIVGSIAHPLWDRGLIWADLDCEFCGDDPDDGDDDPEPEGPDGDGDDLIREITDYLRATTPYATSH
ncbi:hypothetical protein [Streptomyces sp. MN13]